MGYDLHRFHGEVDEELTCPICSGVLEDPVQVFINVKIHYRIFPLLNHVLLIINRLVCVNMLSAVLVLMNGCHVNRHVLLIVVLLL